MRHGREADTGAPCPTGRFGHLAREPGCRRAFGDIGAYDFPAIVGQNDHDVEQQSAAGWRRSSDERGYKSREPPTAARISSANASAYSLTPSR